MSTHSQRAHAQGGDVATGGVGGLNHRPAADTRSTARPPTRDPVASDRGFCPRNIDPHCSDLETHRSPEQVYETKQCRIGATHWNSSHHITEAGLRAGRGEINY